MRGAAEAEPEELGGRERLPVIGRHREVVGGDHLLDGRAVVPLESLVQRDPGRLDLIGDSHVLGTGREYLDQNRDTGRSGDSAELHLSVPPRSSRSSTAVYGLSITVS